MSPLGKSGQRTYMNAACLCLQHISYNLNITQTDTEIQNRHTVHFKLVCQTIFGDDFFIRISS